MPLPSSRTPCNQAASGRTAATLPPAPSLPSPPRNSISSASGESGSAYFAGIQNVEHGVGDGPGEEKDAIDGHRQAPQDPVPSFSIRPEPLNGLLDAQHETDDQQAGKVYEEASQREIGPQPRADDRVQPEEDASTDQKDSH